MQFNIYSIHAFSFRLCCETTKLSWTKGQGDQWSCDLQGTEAWEIRLSSLWRPSKHQDLHSPALQPFFIEVAYRLLSQPQIQSPYEDGDQPLHQCTEKRQGSLGLSPHGRHLAWIPTWPQGNCWSVNFLRRKESAVTFITQQKNREISVFLHCWSTGVRSMLSNRNIT